jgi:hypothetical protein
MLQHATFFLSRDKSCFGWAGNFWQASFRELFISHFAKFTDKIRKTSQKQRFVIFA